MKNWVLASPSIADRFWSLYGWAPLQFAMRFPLEVDATQFRDSHGLHGALVQNVEIDDERRPDIQTDYNPFGLA